MIRPLKRWFENAALRSFLFSLLLCLGISATPIPGFCEITSIEINQAIGNQYKGHQYFVAGKATVVRAFLSEPVTVNKRTKLRGLEGSSAVVKRDGNVVAVLAPKSTNSPTPIVDFLCPNLSTCGNWAEGTYDFEVTVGGDTMVKKGIKFQTRKSIKILAVPLTTNYSGQVIEYPNTKWKTLWTYARDVYPIAGNAIQWVQREELDLSDDEYDLNTDPGQMAVWKALRSLNPSHCPPVGRVPGEDCYDLIVGFMPKNVPDASGYTMGKPANVVTGTDPDAGPTVAHEAAHLFGIGDTYQGGDLHCAVNPAPNGWAGKDWADPDKTVTCTAGAVGYEDIGTKVLASSHPYHVNGRGALGVKADYMGTSGDANQFWTTPETYDWLFTQFAPTTSSSAGIKLAERQRVIAYMGTLRASDDKVTLDPWMSYSDTVSIPDTTGTYTLRALDSSGNTLASQALEVDFYVPGNPPRKLKTAPFQGTMRFPRGTAKFVILKEGTVLAERIVTAAPVISEVTPSTAGLEVIGKYRITWNSSHADSGKLTHMVEYNPDVSDPRSEWIILATGVEKKEWIQNFDDLAGGSNARVRVTVTDGVNARSASSALFRVPFKPPEVFIEELEWGTDYEYGDEILLEAEAYDLRDEDLPDGSIVWSSDISGVLGTGSSLLVEGLPPGTHTITATATNSSHVMASDQVKVTVSACSYEVDPYETAFPSAGGTRLIGVTAHQETGKLPICTLTQDEIQSETYDGGKWLRAQLVSFEDNQGTVKVIVSPNDSRYLRTGTVYVMGNEVDVTQKAAPCTLSLSPVLSVFLKAGGVGQVRVDAPRGCNTKWTAISDRTWIRVTSGASGTGDGIVTFRVSSTTQSLYPRTGHIKINDKVFTITQLRWY